MSRAPSPTRADALAAAGLGLAVLLIFAPGAPRLGFYYDDGAVLSWLPEADLETLWAQMRSYVPGRNLHYLWQYCIYQLAGDPLANLPLLHLIHSALDASVVVAFFLLLRLAGVGGAAACLGAGVFAFWPTHGETHFWTYAGPQNLVSTLFVVVFAGTSLLLARGCKAPWWLWPADALAFLAALFTYDQTFVVLLALAAVRLWSRRHSGFALAHLPYVAAAAFFLGLKLRIPAGHAPVLTSDAPRLLLENIPATLSATFGRLWFRRTAPLLETVTLLDWLLAALAAVLVTGLAIWLLRVQAAPAPPWRLLALAVLLWAAAYLPVWVWHVSQRHHYLPSVALCAGGAVFLGTLLATRRARFAVTAGVGLGVFLLAAACRGESRYWEQSFTAKRQLFTELKSGLAGAGVLALEDFPLYLGPAYFITPQDAEYGPFLLAGIPKGERTLFPGDVSSSPAPSGIFLYTLASLHGPHTFRYYPTASPLVVRFSGWDDGLLRYEKNPARPLPYTLGRSSISPGGGPFAVKHLSARRENTATLLSLRLRAAIAPERHLAAVVSFESGGEFHRWSRRTREGTRNLTPLLLGASGEYELEQDVRLQHLPATARIRLEFYEVSSDRDARPLSHAEADLEL